MKYSVVHFNIRMKKQLTASAETARIPAFQAFEYTYMGSKLNNSKIQNIG